MDSGEFYLYSCFDLLAQCFHVSFASLDHSLDLVKRSVMFSFVLILSNDISFARTLSLIVPIYVYFNMFRSLV